MVKKKEKPLVTSYDGLRALAIAEAAMKSSVAGKVIKLKY